MSVGGGSRVCAVSCKCCEAIANVGWVGERTSAIIEAFRLKWINELDGSIKSRGKEAIGPSSCWRLILDA